MLVFASDLTVKYHCSCSLPIKLSILYEATGSGDPQRMKVTRMTKKHITIFYNHKIFCQQEIMSSWCSPTKFSSDYSWTVLRKMHYIEDDYMSTWSTQLRSTIFKEIPIIIRLQVTHKGHFEREVCRVAGCFFLFFTDTWREAKQWPQESRWRRQIEAGTCMSNPLWCACSELQASFAHAEQKRILYQCSIANLRSLNSMWQWKFLHSTPSIPY